MSWQDASGTGLEDLELLLSHQGGVASGRVQGPKGAPFQLEYTVEFDAQWRTRKVFALERLSGRSLLLRADGMGCWRDQDNVELVELSGAIDVDLSATPFSNTLPIRRLRPEIGESFEIVTAYISVPELTLQADPQRYTRLAETRYRYESLDSDFQAEISVDEMALVTEYPGLFSRRHIG